MTTAPQLLKQAGLRVTKHRVALLNFLYDAHAPQSALSIARTMKKTDQATVYRVLEVFVRKNIARRVDVRKEAVLYELNDSHDHHHLVCTLCDRVEDFSGCAFESLSEKALAKSRHFKKVTSHSFELFGVCKSCDR